MFAKRADAECARMEYKLIAFPLNRQERCSTQFDAIQTRILFPYHLQDSKHCEKLQHPIQSMVSLNKEISEKV